jgi:lipid A 3-O-deacylase
LVATVFAMLALPTTATAQPAETHRGVRVRAMAAGWGTAWRYGIPGYGKTTTDVRFIAWQPALGWFVTRRAEIFGEAALFIYSRPNATYAVGPMAIGARHHFRDRVRLLPFVSGGAGLVFTALDIAELDRRFNGQLFYGAGVRWLRRRGPHWRVEVRNHHISNAGTAGAILGLNAFMLLIGAEWLAR